MKSPIIATLILGMTAQIVQASPFSVLHTFNEANGEWPDNIFLSDGTIYGTTRFGGDNDRGVIFRVDTDGTGFQVLHHGSFSRSYSGSPIIVAGSTIYGTSVGGTGQFYQLGTDGSGFQDIHLFTNLSNNLWRPRAFALSGSTFYGTTQEGGLDEDGGIYKLNTDGTGYQQLFDFTPTTGSSTWQPLVSGSTIYGVTYNGGVNDEGTIFSLQTDGTGYQKLHDFTAADGIGQSPLVDVGGVLYGGSGSSIYKINNDGTGYTVLHTLNKVEGFNVSTPLVLSDGYLYGATGAIVFRISPAGNDFQILYEFDRNTQGLPLGPLAVSNGFVYGSNVGTGTGGFGLIYALAIPEPTTLALATISTLAIAYRPRSHRRSQ